MNDYLQGVAANAIKRFPWHSHGVGVVGDIQSDEWAHALAAEVVDAIVKAERIDQMARGGDTKVILGGES